MSNAPPPPTQRQAPKQPSVPPMMWDVALAHARQRTIYLSDVGCFSGEWIQQVFRSWKLLARHTHRLEQSASGQPSQPCVVLHYKADVAYSSQQPDEPMCLQHLLAASRATNVQA